jgi:energy-coupling factor transporter ATP-binding protein EcfA2
MTTASIYGAFNARWLSPEQVARSFVPTPDLIKLSKLQNSLLMGPRGCGKTTLLKMLTRRAIKVWKDERVIKEPELKDYLSPTFEAIYVPSDIRWAYELSALDLEIQNDPVLAERVQRCAVAVSSLAAAITTFEDLLSGDSASQERVVRSLIKLLHLNNVIPSFSEVRLMLLDLNNELRNAIVSRNDSLIASVVNNAPKVFTGHAFDILDTACTVFDESAPILKKPDKWGFCFDELEIAPGWLQRELLTTLRSINQRFLLKLTWSPVLPEDRINCTER